VAIPVGPRPIRRPSLVRADSPAASSPR